MKDTLRAVNLFRQRGVAAVEAALVFVFLAVFVTAPSVYLAFYFFQYSAAQKAAHDAALYLSTSSRREMMNVGPDGTEPASLTLARSIVAKEMTGLTTATPPDPGIVCGYQQNPSTIGWKPCTTTNTQPLVIVAVSIDMPFIDPLTGNDSGLMISAYTPMRYVGN
jgi:Flp pilus assembly protein TadG